MGHGWGYHGKKEKKKSKKKSKKSLKKYGFGKKLLLFFQIILKHGRHYKDHYYEDPEPEDPFFNSPFGVHIGEDN